jgi:hypothetical protein
VSLRQISIVSDDPPGTVPTVVSDGTACITVWDGTELPPPHVPGEISSSEALIRTTVVFLVRDIRANLLPGSAASCACARALRASAAASHFGVPRRRGP